MNDKRQKVLIVEDEGPLSEVLKDRFENEGSDVIVANDGAQGLILALDHPLWGEVSVSPDAFQVVASSMDRALNPLTPGERRVMTSE